MYMEHENVIAHRMHARKMSAVVLAVALVAVIAVASMGFLPNKALAEHLSGGSGWTVTYTSNGTMSDNYSSSQFADSLSALQPGDDITLTVALKHQNASEGDWYMSNEVIKTLESGAASGSAYSYKLTYHSAAGSDRMLYDSTTVGGDNSNGLIDATNGLDDYFFLETLKNGQSASVTLEITLDGETEGNAYFETLAQLRMKFAVEGAPQGSSTTRTVVRTGDDTTLFPFYVVMIVSGVVLAGVAFATMRRSRQIKGGHAR